MRVLGRGTHEVYVLKGVEYQMRNECTRRGVCEREISTMSEIFVFPMAITQRL